MREELDRLLWEALLTAGVALAIAIFVAGAPRAAAAASPAKRPDATRQGEFGVTFDLPPGDEFGELGDFFNTVSQQLSADRTRSLVRRRICSLPSSTSRTRSRCSTRRASCCSAIRRCSTRWRPTRSANRCRRCCRPAIRIEHSSRRRSRRDAHADSDSGASDRPGSGAQAGGCDASRRNQARARRGRRAGHDARHRRDERRARRRDARVAQPGAAVARAIDSARASSSRWAV